MSDPGSNSAFSHAPVPAPPLRSLAARWHDDWPLLVVLVLYGLLWAPLVPRATDNPHHLAAFSNDDPLITLQLVGMVRPPYGNPANLLKCPWKAPPEWGTLAAYSGFYYGGTYLDIAWLFYAPLKALGLPDFPTAPMVLRGVALAAGMISLLLLYRLGKRVRGRLVAFSACLLLVSDPYFSYYSKTIHPDTTMLALTLAFLECALRQIERGSRRSLVGMGVLAGLVHGAKMGGPWLVPLALLTVTWSGKKFRQGSWLSWFVRRLALLAGTALAAFAVSTPYAFLDDYYFREVAAAWALFTHSPFGTATVSQWLGEIWTSQGERLCVLTLASLGWLSLRCCSGRDTPWELLLAAVLAASVTAWYVVKVRYWICVGYLLPGLAPAGLLAADLICLPALLLRRFGPAGRLLGVIASTGVLLLVVAPRSLSVLSVVLAEHCQQYTTMEEMGRWARTHLPRDSKIIHDDMAYFDPAYFPQARLLGGLITYTSLEDFAPDYFTLSQSIYGASHYVELRRTQCYQRGQEGPFSVLLYQDLLDRGGSPDAELVTTISSTMPGNLSQSEHLLTLLRMVLGWEQHLMGTEIKLYRYRPSGSVSAE